MSERPIVIVTERLEEPSMAWLAARCELVRCEPELDSACEASLAKARGLVIRTQTRVDAVLLDRAPALRVIGRAGVGLDTIDLDACASRDVAVVHTPEANTQAVAEFVFALLLDSLRPRVYLHEPASLEQWRTWREKLVASKQIGDLTLGVYGLGRVGRRVARIGQGFAMRVLYNDLLEIPAVDREGAEPVSAERLFKESDVLSVHVDGRRSNRGLVGAAMLGLMKQDATLINTSRGFVVDALALAAVLRERPGMKALLDVHEAEPLDASNPLLGVAHARLTPHLGASTAHAQQAMSLVVEDVWRVLQGETPRFPASP